MNEQKRMNLFFIFLVVLVVSTAVFSFINYKKPNEYDYNGFTFSKVRLESAPQLVFHELRIYTGDAVYDIPFRNGPEDLEIIPTDNLDVVWLEPSGEADNYDISAQEIYLTFNPKLSGGDLAIAGGEIVKVLGTSQFGVYKIPTGGAVTEITEKNAVIKTCEDANEYTGIILLKLGNETKVYSENDCVVVQGDNYANLIKAADRFIYGLLGVIDS